MLTDEDLLAAYQKMGQDPNDLRRQSDPFAVPPPVTQEAPPPVQEAPPPPVAQEAAPAAPAPEPAVTRARGGLGQQAKAYDDQQLALSNEQIANAEGAHDKSGQTEESHKQAADLLGQKADLAKTGELDTKRRIEERRAQEQVDEQEARNVYAEMKANADPPDEGTLAKVMAIVGAVGALGGKPGLAQGAAMLGDLHGSKLQAWQAGQNAKGNLHQMALQQVSSTRQGEQNDLDIGAKIAAAEAHTIDAALGQVEQMGLSESARQDAANLRIALQQQTIGGLQKAVAAKQQAAAKARATGQDDALWRMPLPALQQLAVGGGLSEKGQKIYADRMKTEQDITGKSLGAQKTAAEVAKLKAEGGDGQGQEVLPGYRATIPLEKKDISDLRANRVTLTDIQGDLKALAQIRARNKGNIFNDPNDKIQAAEILDGLSGKFSVLQGKGAPSKDEKEGIMANLVNPTDTALISDPEKVYANLTERLEGNYQAGLEALGVVPTGGRAGSGNAHPAAPDPRVRSGFARAPSAASRGIVRDEKGGLSLPNVANMSNEEIQQKLLQGEIPAEFLTATASR
jgi:hypothetical protein